MDVSRLKNRLILIVALFLLLASPAAGFHVSLFVPRDDTVFWSSLIRLTRLAADDLGLMLTVYNADNRGETMLEQVKTACSQGADGILFMNYEHLGKKILGISERFRVPALLYNTAFEDPMMVPRKEFPLWIGSMTPDDVRAGGLLAERLIELSKRSGVDRIRMLPIEGNPLEKSSKDRVKGLKMVVSNRDDVTLYKVVNVGKGWSRTKATEVFKSQFLQHPDINTVWAAGDDIALGVLDAMQEMGMGSDRVVTGGVDWNEDAVRSIRHAHNKVSVGGHMFEGAWALVLMYDYLNGMDFFRENTVFKTRMYAIDSNNVDLVSDFLSDSWERIDFTSFSKYQNDFLLYRFDLFHLIDTFYPPRKSFFKLSEQERLWLADHPTIRLGIDRHWAPFEFLDQEGNYKGMVADYVRTLEERLGISFVYSRTVAWPDTLKAMNEHRLDMIAALVETPQRKKTMTFIKPYLTIPLVVITNEQVDFVEDMKVLSGRRVAVVRDYWEHQLLAQLYPEIQLLLAETTAKALESVLTGKAYAYVGNLAVANYAIRKERFTNLKVSGTTPHKLEISMAVRNDWPPFAALIQKAMDSISEQDRDTIYQRWVTLRYEHGFDYALLWQLMLAAFFLLLLSIMYWNRRLSVLNRKLKQEVKVRTCAEEALRSEQEKVKRLVVIDPLTGLFNRRKFKEIFPLEIRRVRRSVQYQAFAIMDVDYFKQYNDYYGHHRGDDVLVRLGKLLLDHCKRATDYPFRLGGEEFGILFTVLDPEQAMVFVERLRAAVEGLAIEHLHNQVSDALTASFGLVVSNNPSDIESMYKAADQALYRAKQGGRNRAEVYVDSV